MVYGSDLWIRDLNLAVLRLAPTSSKSKVLGFWRRNVKRIFEV